MTMLRPQACEGDCFEVRQILAFFVMLSTMPSRMPSTQFFKLDIPFGSAGLRKAITAPPILPEMSAVANLNVAYSRPLPFQRSSDDRDDVFGRHCGRRKAHEAKAIHGKQVKRTV